MSSCKRRQRTIGRSKRLRHHPALSAQSTAWFCCCAISLIPTLKWSVMSRWSEWANDSQSSTLSHSVFPLSTRSLPFQCISYTHLCTPDLSHTHPKNGVRTALLGRPPMFSRLLFCLRNHTTQITSTPVFRSVKPRGANESSLVVPSQSSQFPVAKATNQETPRERQQRNEVHPLSQPSSTFIHNHHCTAFLSCSLPSPRSSLRLLASDLSKMK